MKKYIFLILLSFIILPQISFGESFVLGNGTETCMMYSDPVSWSTDGTNPELHVGVVGLYSDNSKLPLSGSSGTFNWSSFYGGSLPSSRPYTIYNQVTYENGSGSPIPITNQREIVIQDTPCSTPTPTENLATSTVDQTQQNIFFIIFAFFFGLSFVIINFK